MTKPIAVIFIASALTACAVAPAQKPTNSPLQGITEIGAATLERKLTAKGSLHLKGHQLPAVKQSVFIRLRSDESLIGPVFSLYLASEQSCTTGYSVAADYTESRNAIDSAYWPTGTIASPQVDLTIAWDAHEVKVSVANTLKTFKVTYPPTSISIDVSGGAFVIDP